MPLLCACTCIRHDVSAEQLLSHRWSLEAFVSPCLSWSKNSSADMEDSLSTGSYEELLVDPAGWAPGALSRTSLKHKSGNTVMTSEISEGSAWIWAGKAIMAMGNFLHISWRAFVCARMIICAHSALCSLYEKNRHMHAELPHLFHMPSFFLFPSVGYIFWTYVQPHRWLTYIHSSSPVKLSHMSCKETTALSSPLLMLSGLCGMKRQVPIPAL